MIDSKQFYDLVIALSFEDMKMINPKLDSDVARKLVFATFLHESLGGTYLAQVNGPALGVYQMEPTTFDWVYKEGTDLGLLYERSREEALQRLVYDLMFATKLCRIRYWLVPMALPETADIEGLARYWGKYYQTDAPNMDVTTDKEKQFIADAVKGAPWLFGGK